MLSGNVSRLLMRSSIPAGYGLLFHRNLSKVPSDIDVLNDAAAEYMNGMVVGEKAAEAAPVVNEVVVAAADSSIPVAAFQYLIDHVHCSTGLQWWASIAAATLLIRFIHLPIFIKELKLLPAYRAFVHRELPALEELTSMMTSKFIRASSIHTFTINCPCGHFVLCYFKHGGESSLFCSRRNIMVYGFNNS